MSPPQKKYEYLPDTIETTTKHDSKYRVYKVAVVNETWTPVRENVSVGTH